MNALSLVSGSFADDFFPFSLTRSVADIRCGIMTIREKWNLYLQDSSNLSIPISVPANLIPNQEIASSFFFGNPESALHNARYLRHVTDILRYNSDEIKQDFQAITKGRISEPISSTNQLIGTDIFMEPGAIAEHCSFNTKEGPVYIGKNALVMEGSMIRGPFALGEEGVVKMGSRIYGATSAGPYSVLGGEIKNSVIFGYSNKAHDGYLGDSILGEWCNLGAGCSNSNIKNSVGSIKLWNPLKKSFSDAGIKCGLMMGDYSRSAINTSFNTGTVIGASCHVFGNDFTPTYLPSFSWGFNGNIYAFDKAIDHIRKWKKLRNIELSLEEINQLKLIFDQKNNLK